MNIHEYQAKQLLSGFGVPVPAGRLVTDVGQVQEAVAELAGPPWVVKAQIHAGGRGKAGGVRLCRKPAEVEQAASELLGQRLTTAQTGAQGKLVSRLWLEEGVDIAREFYVSLLLDRERACVSFMASPDGGMDIEKVAQNTPERILRLPIHAATGLMPFACRRLAFFLGLGGNEAKAFACLAGQLYTAFINSDASLIELNPLVLTKKGDLVALDAKMTFDDNALYRHVDIHDLRDTAEEDAKEVEAGEHNLNYIALEGDIGCMVNGAGLAMATMDVIQLRGGRPANFLDVGGGVTEAAVEEGFRLLFADERVKAVLVNIFGGIVRCDIIARGLLNALGDKPLPVPVVLRLVGTHEEAGQRLIREAGIKVQWAHDLDEAARLAVAVGRA